MKQRYHLKYRIKETREHLNVLFVMVFYKRETIIWTENRSQGGQEKKNTETKVLKHLTQMV